MNRTKIDWCDSTWNPVTGCKHGCDYCYAKGIAHRFGIQIPDTSEYPEMNSGMHCLKSKLKNNPYPYLFEPTYHPYRLNEPARKTASQTIFVCSMADLFGDWVPTRIIEEVFEACKNAPQHRYLFLTKNPKRYCHLADADKLPALENFWYGSTITKQGQCMFAGSVHWNTFLSIEPLLERIDAGIGSFGGARWLIIGAETGNRAERVKPKPEWVDNIVKTASLTHAAVYMKDNLAETYPKELIKEFPWNTCNHE